MSSTTSVKRSDVVATGRLWWVGLVAAAAAAIGNVILFALAKGPLSISLMVPAQPGSTELEPLAVPMVIGVSVIPALAATGFLAVLGRFVARPMRVFQVVSAIFLLVSFAPVLQVSVGGSTQVILGLMHVVAAVAIVGVLTALARER